MKHSIHIPAVIRNIMYNNNTITGYNLLQDECFSFFILLVDFADDTLILALEYCHIVLLALVLSTVMSLLIEITPAASPFVAGLFQTANWLWGQWAGRFHMTCVSEWRQRGDKYWPCTPDRAELCLCVKSEGTDRTYKPFSPSGCLSGTTFKTSSDMEVSTEAKRIMVVALGKLYSSRTQRGGLRLHRSLLLTLVMKSARDMYHAAQTTAETETTAWEPQNSAVETTTEPATGEPGTLPREEAACSPSEPLSGAENKENRCPGSPPQHSRKRRGKAAVEPDFLPCKKAKLEQANSPQQLIVSAVLMDYVNCSSELGAPPASMPLHRAIAACWNPALDKGR